MKTALKVLVGLVGLVALSAGGFFLWAKSAAASKLERHHEAHQADFPVPFPLSAGELAKLRKEREAERAREAPAAAPAATGEGEPGHAGETAQPPAAEAGAGEAGEAGAAPEPPAAEVEAGAPAAPEPAADVLEGVDLEAIALGRAVARGKHLVESRYVCIECHGEDFSGGTMVDDPAIGRLLGPNITRGKGSRVEGYTPADWDRIVRHGIKRDGTAAAMPSEDFQRMSDQELSDIIAYIQSRPPVDNEVPSVTLGPVGTVLLAVGKLPLSVELIHDHDKPHPKWPPSAEPTAEFGEHLVGICTGCHRAGLEGGPIPAGPPDWVPAANLTPHEQGLAGWSYDDFVKVMREGVRPDGTPVRAPMSLVAKYGNRMSELELRAMWAFISSVQPKPTGP